MYSEIISELDKLTSPLDNATDKIKQEIKRIEGNPEGKQGRLLMLRSELKELNLASEKILNIWESFSFQRENSDLEIFNLYSNEGLDD